MENPYRWNPNGGTRRSFLKGAATLGLTLAATGGARGQLAPVVLINADGSVSTNTTLAANPNVAQWVSPSASVASSLETGRLDIGGQRNGCCSSRTALPVPWPIAKGRRGQSWRWTEG